MSITTKSVKTEESSDFYRKILLSNIKHDLTNPINAILGYAELIMDYIQDSDNQQLKADINNIHASGTLILEKINTIFTQDRKHENDNIGELIRVFLFLFSSGQFYHFLLHLPSNCLLAAFSSI